MPHRRCTWGLVIGIGLGLNLVLFLPDQMWSQPPEPAGGPGLARFCPIDLQAQANQKCKDNFHQNNLPGNNLTALAPGEHRFVGIPFQVGEAVLHLGSQVVRAYPENIRGVKVGTKFTWLYFLHASAYAVNEADVRIGSYLLHYEDGTTQTIPIVNGKDVCGWWKRPGAPEPSEGIVAWEGSNDCVRRMGASIRLFLSTWENPEPDKTVVSLDYASAMTNCAPFCVAITAAKPLQARAVAAPLREEDLERLWKQLAGPDSQASDAIETLAGAPRQAIPFLHSRLRTVQPAAVEKRIALLIGQLDDPNSAVREKAAKELEKRGVEALPQLRWALVKSTWLEVRHRIEPLVEKLAAATPTAEQRRLQRVLLALELMANDGARPVLEAVAKGSAGSWLMAEAEVSLKRLKKAGD